MNRIDGIALAGMLLAACVGAEPGGGGAPGTGGASTTSSEGGSPVGGMGGEATGAGGENPGATVRWVAHLTGDDAQEVTSLLPLADGAVALGGTARTTLTVGAQESPVSADAFMTVVDGDGPRFIATVESMGDDGEVATQVTALAQGSDEILVGGHWAGDLVSVLGVSTTGTAVGAASAFVVGVDATSGQVGQFPWTPILVDTRLLDVERASNGEVWICASLGPGAVLPTEQGNLGPFGDGETHVFVARLRSTGELDQAVELAPRGLPANCHLAPDEGAMRVWFSFAGALSYQPSSTAGPGGAAALVTLDESLAPSSSFVLRAPAGGVLATGIDLAPCSPGTGCDAFVTGGFLGALDIDEGDVIAGQLDDAGGADGFVARVTAGGELEWLGAYGDGNEDAIEGVAVDDDGNLAIAGFHVGTIDFGGGPLEATFGTDPFVAKLGPDGRHLWSEVFPGAGSNDRAVAVGATASGVFVAGGFSGELLLDAGLGLEGDADAFVVALEP